MADDERLEFEVIAYHDDGLGCWRVVAFAPLGVMSAKVASGPGYVSSVYARAGVMPSFGSEMTEQQAWSIASMTLEDHGISLHGRYRAIVVETDSCYVWRATAVTPSQAFYAIEARP